jgi:hypothetical protein
MYYLYVSSTNAIVKFFSTFISSNVEDRGQKAKILYNNKLHSGGVYETSLELFS